MSKRAERKTPRKLLENQDNFSNSFAEYSGSSASSSNPFFSATLRSIGSSAAGRRQKLRFPPFTTISGGLLFLIPYMLSATFLKLPLGDFAFWLLAPSTWWAYMSFGSFLLGWFVLIELASRERKRKQEAVKKPKTFLDLQSESRKEHSGG